LFFFFSSSNLSGPFSPPPRWGSFLPLSYVVHRSLHSPLSFSFHLPSSPPTPGKAAILPPQSFERWSRTAYSFKPLPGGLFFEGVRIDMPPHRQVILLEIQRSTRTPLPLLLRLRSATLQEAPSASLIESCLPRCSP